MQYTIKPESKLQCSINSIKSKGEDIFLSSVMLIAKYSKSQSLNSWIEKYTNKRIQKMKAEIIHMNWDKVTLDKTTEAIHSKAIHQKEQA